MEFEEFERAWPRNDMGTVNLGDTDTYHVTASDIGWSDLTDSFVRLNQVVSGSSRVTNIEASDRYYYEPIQYRPTTLSYNDVSAWTVPPISYDYLNSIPCYPPPSGDEEEELDPGDTEELDAFLKEFQRKEE